MRVAFLTTGRFHVLDIARELEALGHELRFYSLLPTWRTRRLGLSDRSNRWLGPYVAPVYGAAKLAPAGVAKEILDHALLASLDAMAARVIEPCDVLVAMSGLGLRALSAVQRKYGAVVFLERSSRHILSQRAILGALPSAGRQVTDSLVHRELAGYGLADYLTVPSRQVMESFLEQGTPPQKLFLNPFGVSLEVFQPTRAPDASVLPTIITTGAWSRRKGCDVLVEAWRKLSGTRLLHVGPVVDVPLPTDPLFEHVDAVAQSELVRYYAQGHVFVLASREEGLAVVQAQALACGLPLVCTTRTGGADFAGLVNEQGSITVVPPDDVEALATALANAMARRPKPGVVRDLLKGNRPALSWRACAERYATKMQAVLDARRSVRH